MSTTTTRMGLTKPALNESADITVINTNMDTIDGAISKCNFSAAVAPVVGDDSGDGYDVGSLWVDTTGHAIYLCEDNTLGAAVWRQIYPAAGPTPAAANNLAKLGAAGAIEDSGVLTSDVSTAVSNSHAATLIGTKTIDETDIADSKTIVYNSGSGKLEYETYHIATLIGTKTIDETDIGNGKVIAYNSGSGNLEYETAGAGDVLGPGANTDGNIPQWNGADSKTLKDGLALATTVGSPGSDSTLVSEQGIREGLDGLVNGATSDTGTPEGASDYLLIYDNTNSAHRKITPNTLAKRREAISIGSQSMWPSTTSGATAAAKTEASTNKENYYGAAFVHTSKTYLEFGFALPNKYDGGTITARFFWYQTGTSTNGVCWGLQGRCYGDGETIDQAFGTAQEVIDNGTATASQELRSAETAAITLAGTPAGGEWAMIRVYRDPANGSDDLDDTVYLMGVQLFVGINAWSD